MKTSTTRTRNWDSPWRVPPPVTNTRFIRTSTHSGLLFGAQSPPSTSWYPVRIAWDFSSGPFFRQPWPKKDLWFALSRTRFWHIILRDKKASALSEKTIAAQPSIGRYLCYDRTPVLLRCFRSGNSHKSNVENANAEVEEERFVGTDLARAVSANVKSTKKTRLPENLYSNIWNSISGQYMNDEDIPNIKRSEAQKCFEPFRLQHHWE